MKYKNYKLALLIIMSVMSGCKKYLSTPPDISLTIPSTLNAFQALMEKDFMYKNIGAFAPVLAADNYYIDYSTWKTWSINYRNSYIWAKDIYEGTPSNLVDWGMLYQIVYTSNIVLDGVKQIKITQDNKYDYNFVKGMALFYRAYAFWSLAQVYAKPYIKLTAGIDLGIPLRLTPNLNNKSKRASVEATYEQIIEDLKEAALLLPSTIQTNHLNYPSVPAVYALLARVYLSMRDYNDAGSYADSSLQYYHTLIDYNSLDTTLADPFIRTNAETMFQAYVNAGIPVIRINYANKLVDTTLYNSYASNDLRKTIFYSINNNGKPYFTGTYTGTSNLCNGFATDEMYLTKAECEARSGEANAAISDLNLLLDKRWKTGTFVPYYADNADAALKLILQERRKELVCRGLRWMDLRRLNQEPEFADTLKRVLVDTTYTLLPDDPRYVYPIPNDEIILSGLPQNKR